MQQTEITITEALAEVNLIKNKIDSKKAYTKSLLYRGSHQMDGFADKGGADKVYTAEEQSIRDLRSRLVKIRAAISKANIETQIQIGDESRTIFDWLTWKRECYQDEATQLQIQINELQQLDAREKSRPEVWKDEKGDTQIVRYVRNVSLADLQKRLETITDKFNRLDGQLSLKNATVRVTVN